MFLFFNSENKFKLAFQYKIKKIALIINKGLKINVEG